MVHRPVLVAKRTGSGRDRKEQEKMSKERNQNPIVGDTVTLRLITYNSNSYKSVSSIEEVNIYRLDPNQCSSSNTDGRVLVETVTSGITTDQEGFYHIDLATTYPTYLIGKYLDVWSVIFEENDETALVDNRFELYPDLWYASTMPAIYGFDFSFQPNKIRQGSVKWLMITVTPNVPRATELERYYVNLAIAAEITISMEKVCGACVPSEQDLKMVFEDEAVSYRDKLSGYYLLDTRDLDCGIYNVWFTMNFAGTIEVSQKLQLQIF